MKYRKLGKAGFDVSEISYGAWGIGGIQWLGGTDGESTRALRRAIELGLNFIDTALAYGDGHSEQLVGQELLRRVSGRPGRCQSRPVCGRYGRPASSLSSAR